MNENENTCNSGIDNVFYDYSDKLDNPRKLTTAQLKEFMGLESISETLAQEIIDGLYKLTIITYKAYQNGNRTI